MQQRLGASELEIRRYLNPIGQRQNFFPDAVATGSSFTIIVTSENRGGIVQGPIHKTKRADLCYEHEVSPRTSTFSRKDEAHGKS